MNLGKLYGKRGLFLKGVLQNWLYFLRNPDFCVRVVASLSGRQDIWQSWDQIFWDYWVPRDLASWFARREDSKAMHSGCFVFFSDSDSRRVPQAVGLYRDSATRFPFFLACFHEGPHFTRMFPVKKIYQWWHFLRKHFIWDWSCWSFFFSVLCFVLEKIW